MGAMGRASDALAETAEGPAIELARRFEREKRDLRSGIFVIADPDDRVGLEVTISSMQCETGISRETAVGEIQMAVAPNAWI